jgi:hypothetical protein
MVARASRPRPGLVLTLPLQALRLESAALCIGCGCVLSVACGGPEFTASSAPPPSEAGPGDARSLPPPDAPGSEAEAGDAAAGTWCSTQTGRALFCDDFDSLPLPSNFGRVDTTGNGMLSYDTAVVRSAPNALLASTPLATTANSTATALLSRSFLHDGTHVVFQADLQIDAHCLLGADTVAPVAIYFPDYALVLLAGATSTQLVELTFGADGGVNGGTLHAIRTMLPVDAWFTLVVDAQLDNGRTVDVAVSGANVLQGQKLELEPSTAPQHPTLVVGASVSASAGSAAMGCSVHIDDVLADIRLQ